jgi:hypothetical protein
VKKVLISVLALAALAGLSTPAATATAPTADVAALQALSMASGPARMTPIRDDDEDPEEKGACIQSVGSLRTCNDITRRYCITGGFARATFYPGETCDSLKKQGYY